MAHGINANVVHRWRKLARGGDTKTVSKTGKFIALALTMSPALVPPTAPIRRCRPCRWNCAAAQTAQFEAGLKNAKRITLQAWRDQSLREKAPEQLASLLSTQL